MSHDCMLFVFEKRSTRLDGSSQDVTWNQVELESYVQVPDALRATCHHKKSKQSLQQWLAQAIL